MLGGQDLNRISSTKTSNFSEMRASKGTELRQILSQPSKESLKSKKITKSARKNQSTNDKNQEVEIKPQVNDNVQVFPFKHSN